MNALFLLVRIVLLFLLILAKNFQPECVKGGFRTTLVLPAFLGSSLGFLTLPNTSRRLPGVPRYFALWTASHCSRMWSVVSSVLRQSLHSRSPRRVIVYLVTDYHTQLHFIIFEQRSSSSKGGFCNMDLSCSENNYSAVLCILSIREV